MLQFAPFEILFFLDREAINLNIRKFVRLCKFKNEIYQNRISQTLDVCWNFSGFGRSLTWWSFLVLVVFFNPYYRINCINSKININKIKLRNLKYHISCATRRMSFSFSIRFFSNSIGHDPPYLHFLLGGGFGKG